MSYEEVDSSYMLEEFDPYQTLNVTPDATLEEIQESFKKLSRTFHPDRTLDANTLLASRQEFEAITRAKEILCNSQMRQAYDNFGVKGIEMMQRNMYQEIQSLQIGKKYRNDDAVKHLLKYYLKQEAKLELDKLISSHGHCEVGIDATSMYQEFIDLIFRHETIPQFISNVYNGLPTLQVVINPDMDIYEPDTDTDEDDAEVSMSELMSLSVEDQVSVIQNALATGDMTILKNIPVERQSISPSLMSFLISLGFTYEYNDDNTWMLSLTQYNDDMDALNNKIYQNINIEWHKQYNRFLKFVSGISMGLQTFSSRFTISRTIDTKTSIDINLFFNWLQMFGANDGNPNIENAADLFGNMLSESEKKPENTSYLHVIPELFSVFKNGLFWGYNFIKKMSIFNGTFGGYPGFDISFGIQRIIFNEWMGASSIRMGKNPSFSWSLSKNRGPKQWDFKIDVSPKTFVSLICKHNKKIDANFGFYMSLQLDLMNVVKVECGFNKLIEPELPLMIEKEMITELDIKQSFGIDISLKQGISIKFGLKRGPSQISVPIKCTESYSSLKQILLSFTIPLITYYGYKLFYKPYAIKWKSNKATKHLNENGLSLHNKRQFALKQQSIMNRQSEPEKYGEGLVILCAYYGDHVEGKLFDAIRKYTELDKEDEDNYKEEEEHEEEEKEKEIENSINTNNGKPPPPPLLFNVYGNGKNENENENKIKNKKKMEDEMYKIKVCEIDWLSVENELEALMRENANEDMHLLSFINVRIVLQYMVDSDKSELVLSSGDKSYLPGFYHCCPDKYVAKELFVIYKYKEQHKYVTVSNMFPLTLPNDSHLEWFNCRDSGY